jgi:hypothetical protein
MKIIIESTSKIVELNGVPARIWEGTTESGIELHCFITRVAIDEEETRTEEFERELKEQKKPSVALECYPLRMII